MIGGVCFATRSEGEYFFFDIDVKGGEKSHFRNVEPKQNHFENGRIRESREAEFERRFESEYRQSESSLLAKV
jgi:hypothetical protein